MLKRMPGLGGIRRAYGGRKILKTHSPPYQNSQNHLLKLLMLGARNCVIRSMLESMRKCMPKCMLKSMLRSMLKGVLKCMLEYRAN